MDATLAEAATLRAELIATDPEEYDSTAKEVPRKLQKQAATEAALLTLLQKTDPASLTIPYYHALSSLIEASWKPSRNAPAELLPEGKLWPAITKALLEFDPIQIRYVGHQFSRVISLVAHGAEQTSNFVPAIQLLQAAILRLDPTSSTLTTAHHSYLRLCLLARAYPEAIAILKYPIYHIPTSDALRATEGRLLRYLCLPAASSVAYINQSTGLTSPITTRIYLEYFLLGALAYMAVRDFVQAQHFLEIVLSTPTHQNLVSNVQVEAYKKWLLISLLCKGDETGFPKNLSQNAAKQLRPITKPYECVVDAFKSRSIDKLQAEIQEGLQIWQDDGNYGLIFEVVAAFRKFAVTKLARIFAAVSIEEVAIRTSPNPQDLQETVTFLQSLIMSGALQAQITPSQQGGAGTLRFLQSIDSQRTEGEVEQALQAKTLELRTLMKYISDYDHQLEVNKDYLDFLLKAKRARDVEKKSAKEKNAKDPPVGKPQFDEDEDMMDDWQ